MIAKVFRVVCHVVAGFFIYMVSLLAFTKLPSAATKVGIMVGFSIPAVCAILIGLAVDRFRHKWRDLGIVLLSSAGFTAFLVLTFACLLQEQAFKNLMKPDALSLFTDYVFGFGFMVAVAIVGLIALRAGSTQPDQLAVPTAAAVTSAAAQKPRKP